MLFGAEELCQVFFEHPIDSVACEHILIKQIEFFSTLYFSPGSIGDWEQKKVSIFFSNLKFQS